MLMVLGMRLRRLRLGVGGLRAVLRVVRLGMRVAVVIVLVGGLVVGMVKVLR